MKHSVNQNVRKNSKWQAILALGVFAVLGLILWPIHSHPTPSPGTSCLSKVKQLTVAMLMYSAGWQLPARDVWMNSIAGYHKNETLVHCTEVRGPKEYGYAFNSLLERMDLSKVANPEKQPMIFDSINLARNASDPVISLPQPGRHEGKNSIGYADGRASKR